MTAVMKEYGSSGNTDKDSTSDKKKIILIYYHWYLFSKLQDLKQGNKSVVEYMEELFVGQARCELDELEDVTAKAQNSGCVGCSGWWLKCYVVGDAQQLQCYVVAQRCEFLMWKKINSNLVQLSIFNFWVFWNPYKGGDNFR